MPRPVALLPRPNGTSLVIKTETHDEDGALVNEQYVTEFFRGVQADDGVGERAPDHRLEADGDPIAEITYLVAQDQTARYAAASGDDFAIHLDDEFARGVGLPGRIVHGLCTMAFAGRAVLDATGVDESADGRANRCPLLGSALPRRFSDDAGVGCSTARSPSSRSTRRARPSSRTAASSSGSAGLRPSARGATG